MSDSGETNDNRNTSKDTQPMHLREMANAIRAQNHGYVAVTEDRTARIEGMLAQDLSEGLDHDLLGMVD